MHALLVSVVLLSTVHGITPHARPARHATVELYDANTNEHLRFRLYDERGRTRADAVRALTRLLRCRQTGQQHRVDPRLVRALYRIGQHYPGRRIEIYSGYRPRAYCTRRHSRHLTASAIDFHVSGVPNAELIMWLRHAFHPAGVGYYPHGVHVHFDLDRAHDTYWVDAGDDRTGARDGAVTDAETPGDGEDPPMDDPAFVD